MHQMPFGERADLIVIGEHPLKASAALDGVAVAVSRTPPLRRATGSKGRKMAAGAVGFFHRSTGCFGFLRRLRWCCSARIFCLPNQVGRNLSAAYLEFTVDTRALRNAE